ncbi:MAG TPA: YciI family protein [Solirubrobacteraceae bacterium]|nr:YciI family protein [Solirubrobacteraceae bacterium]
MQYALLIYRRPDDFDGLSEDEQQAISAEYYRLRDDPHVIGGGALQPTTTATTLRRGDAQMLVSDGPYADTKEVFGGWYIVEAADLDTALDVAGRVPVLRLGGAVEVRPLMEGPH